MPIVDVIDLSNNKVGTVELSEAVFGQQLAAGVELDHLLGTSFLAPCQLP